MKKSLIHKKGIFALTLLLIVNLEKNSFAKSAKEIFDRAEIEFRAFDYEQAWKDYEQALQEEPSAAWASIARTRMNYLKAHSEDNFQPLARLERVRKTPSLWNMDEIRRLHEDATHFAQGMTKSEALMFVAQTYRDRLNQPELAERAFQEMLADEKGDELLKGLAVQELIQLLRVQGRIDDAVHIADRFKKSAGPLRQELKREVRRIWVLRVARGIMGVSVLFAIMSVVVGIRNKVLLPKRIKRWFSGFPLLYSILVGTVSTAIAYVYDADIRPFLLVALCLWVSFLFSDLLEMFLCENRMRIVRAAGVGLFFIAAVLLVLNVINPAYLTVFRL